MIDEALHVFLYVRTPPLKFKFLILKFLFII